MNHTVRIRALKMINGKEHVLLVKEREQLKTKIDGEQFIKWPGRSIPGGRVVPPQQPIDFTEHLRAEGAREFEEETGLTIRPEDLSPIPKIFPQDGNRNVYLFEVNPNSVQGELNPRDPDILSAEWVERWQVFGDYGSTDKPILCSDRRMHYPILFRSHEKFVHFPSWGDTDPQELNQTPA